MTHTYLVTGAAGFIGSNFIKYLLHKKYVNEPIRIIVLDALTYAGNHVPGLQIEFSYL